MSTALQEIAASRDASSPLRAVGEEMREAETHFAAGRLCEAAVALETLLPRATGRGRQNARLLLACIYGRRSEDVRKAEAALQSVLDDDPNHAEAWYALGLLYRKNGVSGKSAACFRRVLRLDPGHARARQELRERAAPAAPVRSGLLDRLFALRR